MNRKKVSQGVTNKRKGSDAERHYMNVFRKIGFKKCVTSRLGSKLHDDTSIDLIMIPFNIQIKAGIQRGLNPSQVLLEMDERIKKHFPPEYPEHHQAKIMIHRKQGQRGKKRGEMDDIVSMSFRDFRKYFVSPLYKLD